MPPLLTDDTIAAVATGAAPAGVGIVRLSGRDALACARRLADLPEPMPERTAVLARLRAPGAGDLDEALVLWFRAPASYTGEDVVELQGHGGIRQLDAVLRAAIAAGARAAEPGEFTRRAVLHGRMSLERAEALADLVAAETEAGLAAARAQLLGALGRALDAIAADALALRAEGEASLDFPEAAGDAPPALVSRAEALARACEALLATHASGRALREGVRVVLAGAPNSGKSSLFNALLGEPRALVDAEPGTTRDVLEARLELEGVPCTLVDTAGLREGAGRVEQLGIERARAEIARGGLCLWVIDATAPVPAPEQGTRWIEVANKCDLAAAAAPLQVSARTGRGLEELRAAMARHARGGEAGAHGEVLVTHRRHAEELARAAAAFRRAADSALPLELACLELGEGAGALDRIRGRGVDDALLDEIFARFCVGK